MIKHFEGSHKNIKQTYLYKRTLGASESLTKSNLNSGKYRIFVEGRFVLLWGWNCKKVLLERL